MFPGGSPELVGPVYQNPILSAPFNEQLAAAVQSYCNDMLQVLVCCTQAMFCMPCLVLMLPFTERIGRCSPHICGRRAWMLCQRSVSDLGTCQGCSLGPARKESA